MNYAQNASPQYANEAKPHTPLTGSISGLDDAVSCLEKDIEAIAYRLEYVLQPFDAPPVAEANKLRPIEEPKSEAVRGINVQTQRLHRLSERIKEMLSRIDV